MKTGSRRNEFFYKNKCERLEKIIEEMTSQIEDMQSQLRDYASLDGFDTLPEMLRSADPDYGEGWDAY